MDGKRFDLVARLVSQRFDRRTFALLGGAAVTGWFGLTSVTAKGKNKKKSPFCLNGQTVEAGGKKKKKKLTGQGATRGACQQNACTPQCGTTCGGSDGCGGTCTCNAGSICTDGTCAACTVMCDADAATCGTRLSNALANGGAIVACPGRYAGNFTVTRNTTLTGAGPGSDAATSTILDGQESGRVLLVGQSLNAALSGVRLTKGKLSGAQKGGGISPLVNSELHLNNCAVVDNFATDDGGGIHTRGKLLLANSEVTNNRTGKGGAGIFFDSASPSTITNSVISRNDAVEGPGGGILGKASTLTISGTTFERNDALDDGGGLHLTGGGATFDSACRLTANTSSVGLGGGIFGMSGATVALNGATLSGNSEPQCRVNGTNC